MTSRSYFGKMNSILGSVVPLAMFFIYKGTLTLTLTPPREGEAWRCFDCAEGILAFGTTRFMPSSVMKSVFFASIASINIIASLLSGAELLSGTLEGTGKGRFRSGRDWSRR